MRFLKRFFVVYFLLLLPVSIQFVSDDKIQAFDRQKQQCEYVAQQEYPAEEGTREYENTRDYRSLSILKCLVEFYSIFYIVVTFIISVLVAIIHKKMTVT